MEMNYSDMAVHLDEQEEYPDFRDILQSTEEEVVANAPYCKQWIARSGLRILKKKQVYRAWERKGPLGLTMLFMRRPFIQALVHCINPVLASRGVTQAIDLVDTMAYIGLEIASSLTKVSALDLMWSNDMFARLPDFQAVMSRDSFRRIRSSLRFYPHYDHDVAIQDPLWHSRIMLQHFCRNAASVAVPSGVMSYDENTILCKGRTRARSYMKSKPIKFGIRFYANVCWASGYLHCLCDNGSGNLTNLSPAVRCSTVFKQLRSLLANKMDDALVPNKSASAGWALQIAHATNASSCPQGRLVVTDNAYTRPALGHSIQALTDEETVMLGTVRLNNMESPNRAVFKEAMGKLKDAPRGTWYLCQAYRRKVVRTSETTVIYNAGFVVWKDRTMVTFYSNDLAGTPSERIAAQNEESVRCVHGLTKIRRWLGTEAQHPTVVEVPAIIMAYNLFMNGVDRFDQMRATNTIARKEPRVPMSIFTFLLDASIQNGYALYRTISTEGGGLMPLREFKRRVAESLVAPRLARIASRIPAPITDNAEKTRACAVGAAGTTRQALRSHMILALAGGGRALCYLCRLRRVHRPRALYGCVQCRLGFHVHCFTAYHHRDSFPSSNHAFHTTMRNTLSAIAQRKSRAKPVGTIPDLSTFMLPSASGNSAECDEEETPVGASENRTCLN